MMKRTHGGLVVCLLALATGLLMAAAAQQTGSNAPTKAAKAAKNPVQEISLPQYPPELPAGPNLDVFQNKCLLCHSARYVTMQPRFSRTVWEKEVKKMVDAYGASISAPEQQQIVDYLVAIKGPTEGN
jgi:cytochrome c5